MSELKNKDGKHVISVEVDRSAELEAMEEKLKQMEEERDDAKARLEAIAQAEFEKQSAEVVKHGYPMPKNPSELVYAQNQIKEREQQENNTSKGATGTVQNYSSGGQPFKPSGGFENYEDMVSFLRKQEKEGNTEAKEILGKMFAKAFQKLENSRSAYQLSGSLQELKDGKFRLVEKDRANSENEDAQLERE